MENQRGLTELISNSHIDASIKQQRMVPWVESSWSGWWQFYTLAAPNFATKIKDALADKMFVPFKFDFNGSKIIFFHKKM